MMADAEHAPIDALFDRFQQDCSDYLDVYYKALALHNEQPEVFSEKMRDMLIEHIFVQMFSKWEKYLESIFIEYMLGESSLCNGSFVRYANPVDREHAYSMIQNVNQYPDWADIEKVLKNARNFFENGGPFEILATLKGDIVAIRKLRNSIAHLSVKARLEFENLVRGKVGFLPDGITPAKFLVEYKVGRKKADPTYCEYYIRYLNDTAKLLIEFNPDTEA